MGIVTVAAFAASAAGVVAAAITVTWQRIKSAAIAAMGSASVVLLRGHGNVVVGPTMPITVFRAYYTEINARQQLNAMALGPNDVVYMDAGECETTDKIMQSVAGRP